MAGDDAGAGAPAGGLGGEAGGSEDDVDDDAVVGDAVLWPRPETFAHIVPYARHSWDTLFS